MQRRAARSGEGKRHLETVEMANRRLPLTLTDKSLDADPDRGSVLNLPAWDKACMRIQDGVGEYSFGRLELCYWSLNSAVQTAPHLSHTGQVRLLQAAPQHSSVVASGAKIVLPILAILAKQ